MKVENLSEVTRISREIEINNQKLFELSALKTRLTERNCSLNSVGIKLNSFTSTLDNCFEKKGLLKLTIERSAELTEKNEELYKLLLPL